ncbi:MAG: hypothetical protein EAZ34_10570 [Polaromonas sp.]|nr:MAG: hypothetical protein EAZ34_10570 [Polaromonas sp.]
MQRTKNKSFCKAQRDWPLSAVVHSQCAKHQAPSTKHQAPSTKEFAALPSLPPLPPPVPGAARCADP